MGEFFAPLTCISQHGTGRAGRVDGPLRPASGGASCCGSWWVTPRWFGNTGWPSGSPRGARTRRTDFGEDLEERRINRRSGDHGLFSPVGVGDVGFFPLLGSV